MGWMQQFTWARWLMLGTGLLGAGGCLTVGPDYERPEPDLPDAWNQAVVEDLKSETPDLLTWWTVFGDEQLDALIQKAVQDNLNLKVAQQRIVEARALRGISASQYYPQLGGDGSISATRASEETTPTLPEGVSLENDVYRLGLSLGWELDLFGRVRRSVEAADASMEAAVENYRDLLVLLNAEIALNYMDVRAFQDRILIAQENAEAQADTLNLTQDRLELGLVGELDVRQAELNLASTRSIIPALQRELSRSVHRLGVLTGEVPSHLYASLAEIHPTPLPPARIAVGLPADLLRQRPDLRRAERELASQHARIGAAKAELYPIFSLPGTFALEAFDAGNLGSSALTYGFGPAFRWNLFSGGRVRSQVRAEEARTQQALLIYEQTVLTALEDVENAMIGLARERVRMQELILAATAAEKSVGLVKTLYTSGLTNFQNVLDMERSLLQQQDALAESRGNVSAFAIQLYRALGGGWSPDPDSGPPMSAVPNASNPEDMNQP